MRKSAARLSLAIVSLVLVSAPLASAQMTNGVIFPTGLTYDGSVLYLSTGNGARDLMRLDPTTGAVLGSSPLGGNPRDVTYAGSGRFLATDEGRFVREFDLAGTTHATMPIPFRGGGIAFDGTFIYASDIDASRLVRVLDRFGNFVRQFDSGLRPEGMVFDPATGNLWVITLNSSTLYEISTEGQLRRRCRSPFEPGPFGLGGITLVGNNIYIAGPIDGDPFRGTVIHVLDRNSLECEVVDVAPPVIGGLTAGPAELWPFNNKMVDVFLNYSVSDDSGETPTVMISVTNNETGDLDWEFVDAHHIRLRASRFGSGSGRVYTVTITAIDSAGNVTTQTIAVTVPHDRRK